MLREVVISRLAPSPAPGGPIVLYDGVCGLCNRYVDFILRRDHRERFRFASLQGAFGQRALATHGLPAEGDPSSIVLLESPGLPAERARVRSDAVLAVLTQLGGAWTLMAVFRLVPRFLRDAAYAFVARIRYQVFGRLEACPLPSASNRSRFLD
jgi:predicted DCC family thiol-disulfide oxidoreductase YuxK